MTGREVSPTPPKKKREMENSERAKRDAREDRDGKDERKEGRDGREREGRDRRRREKSSSRSRSPDRKRDRSRERSGRHRSRTRSRSGSRDRHSRRRDRRSYSRSRSPRDRRRDRNGSRRDRRSRSRSPTPPRRNQNHRAASSSLSPMSRKMKLREEKRKAEANKFANKFWDGFQWVERTPVLPAATVSSATGPTPPISLAQQKDRRIYLGNLPNDVTAEFLKDFMNSAMLACGAVPAGVTAAVLSVWLGPDNKYAFIELCTTEAATVALGLNGISCMGSNLRVARPKTYNGDSGAGYPLA